MSNSTILFTAKRSLVSGVVLEDEIQIDVNLTVFDESREVKKDSITMMDGSRESSLLYIANSYRCKISDLGTVTLPGPTTTDLTLEYMSMFSDSVAADEEFTFYNPNTGLTMDCQMTQSITINRVTTAYLDKFNYSFIIREVVA